jgi:hypothetical protein
MATSRWSSTRGPVRHGGVGGRHLVNVQDDCDHAAPRLGQQVARVWPVFGGRRMTFLLYYIAAWVAGLIAAFVTGSIKNLRTACETFLLWQLVIGVGLTGFLGAAGHLFSPDSVARSIGWATGSPFQTELGYCCLAMGILGVMCWWFRDGFWLATIVFVTVFLAGASIVHVQDMVRLANFNPGNAVTTVPDLLGPVTLIVLWVLARWGVGTEQA